VTHYATTALVIGRRKFGKSTYLREHVLPKLPLPVAVLDVKGEYGPDDGFTEIYYTLDDFLDAPQFWRASLRFDLSDTAAAFDALYYYSPHVLVVEEAHLYCSPHNIDPNLSRLVRMGGEPGISLILVSQRVRDFPQIVYSMADRVVIFQQRSPHDVDALEEIIGDGTDGITTLERGKFKEFDL